MTIAIMQPYIFPYLGYFQLIMAVDKFVFFDDVNFIKRGWINRNQILLNDQEHLFSIPLNKPSQNRKINETMVSSESKWRDNFLTTLKIAYKKAPYFDDLLPMVEEVMNKMTPRSSISDLAISSIVPIADYLELQCEFLRSSDLEYDRSGNGQDKILDLSNRLNASTYINPINGAHLYSETEFEKNGLELLFIEMDKSLEYPQFGNKFVSALSIIDVLMFNSRQEATNLMGKYQLV